MRLTFDILFEKYYLYIGFKYFFELFSFDVNFFGHLIWGLM